MILTPKILLRIAALLLLTVLLQVSFFSRIELLGGSPDMAVLVVVILGLLGGVTVGAVAGFCVGLLIDCLIGGALGATGLAMILVGYLAGLYRERAVRPAGRLTVPVVCLVLTLVAEVAMMLVQLMLGLSGPFSGTIIWDVAIKALYAFGLSYPVYVGIRRLLRPALIEAPADRHRTGSTVFGL